MDKAAPVAQDGFFDLMSRMLAVFGFHDLSSFFIAFIFLIAMLAFIVSGVIFIVKTHKERKKLLNKIVEEVQNEALKKHIEKPQEKAPEPAPKPSIVEKKAEPIKEPQPLKVAPASVPVPPVVQEIKEEPRALSLPEPEREEPKIETVLASPQPIVVEEAPEKAPAESAGPDYNAVLKNTREGFMQKLWRLFSASPSISEADFDELESILFTADIGTKTAQKLLDTLRERVRAAKNADKAFLEKALKEEMLKTFASAKSQLDKPEARPKVIMFVGVNGAGKTTSIAKFGAKLKASGHSVIFAAGDTFRAAAVEQLSVWGDRIGVEVIKGAEKADSASVLFDAVKKGEKLGVELVLCDTAGRLHTKSELMDELAKVHRVLAKAHPGAPHEVFLVIDATMGQNAISQAREFSMASPLSGIILSKLDGTAKGGVALGIVDELKVPIRYIGVGEKVSDLQEFDAAAFVEALFFQPS
jgi:fused signal recognition particle receptor